MLTISGEYPANWKEIATAVKESVNWHCVRCAHPDDTSSGYTLTVHHLDGNKANCLWFNLIPLCQRCHLSIQARVIPNRPWLFDHSEWFKPYVGGWSAYYYLGLTLSRPQVMSRLAYYANLQRSILLGQVE